jgi:cardiolipin synthase
MYLRSRKRIMEYSYSPITILAAAQMLLALGISVRVIMNRPATGVALAWLVIVALVPYLGAAAYLIIGERRISPRRMARLSDLRVDFRRFAERTIEEGLNDVDWSRHPPAARSMDILGINTTGIPTVTGSSFELISDTQEILLGIAKDIDAAQKSVLMEFYIWHEGGTADLVLEALIRAAERGIHCIVLVDALGAGPWWRGRQPSRLRKAGVEIQPALPVGIFRSLVGRTDLRLHRKIVIIDGEAAWTGSMNLVDPRFFKQGGGFGEWVDAMVRLEGTAVAPLAAILVGDWVVETGTSIRALVEKSGLRLTEPKGTADVQVVASGPASKGNGLLKMMHAMINSAQEELILTTPYLVPDDSILWALRGAVGRGVSVKLVVPKTVDSFLTRHASHSYYDGLLRHGMEIHRYNEGLLHTKSIMVDEEISMFGTVNLDMRSLWLNNEVSLFVYDRAFACKLKELQLSYIADSERLDPEAWDRRPIGIKFLENTMRLMSPLL